MATVVGLERKKTITMIDSPGLKMEHGRDAGEVSY